jgi:hypothetical protein
MNKSTTTFQSMNANSNQTPNQLRYSRRDAAKILGGISDRSVDNYTRSGDLRPTKVGGRVMYHKDELNRFAAQGTKK